MWIAHPIVKSYDDKACIKKMLEYSNNAMDMCNRMINNTEDDGMKSMARSMMDDHQRHINQMKKKL